MDRSTIVHENLLARVASGDLPQGKPPSGPLSAEAAVTLWQAACLTRALDRQSRVMQRAGQGFYTIGSSGHEGMGAVALALPGPLLLVGDSAGANLAAAAVSVGVTLALWWMPYSTGLLVAAAAAMATRDWPIPKPISSTTGALRPNACW